jgi:acyl-coenzyme A thioesterase PaaI-like protein
MVDELPVDADAAALADELRAITVALVSREVAPGAVAEALPLARALREKLQGPLRARWWEQEVGSPMRSAGARRSFQDMSPLRGILNPVAPPLAMDSEQGPDGVRLVGRVRLSRAYEGPPHGVHGGIVAALFDEMLGAAQNLAPPVGVTAKLEVRYRHVTPIEEDLRFDAWVEENRVRRLTTRATCHAGSTLTADARGLFVRVDFAEVEQYMSARRGDR